MRPWLGKLSPAPPAAVFMSASEGGSKPNAALNPSKHVVMAYLLCYGLATRGAPPEHPRKHL